mmetsp:Transcript_39721/g.104913  ORF Transcript_39721/g.104913 Transcript_39721/m.104913 type:complete len:208 (-) Transcript_39721:172-795(-)
MDAQYFRRGMRQWPRCHRIELHHSARQYEEDQSARSDPWAWRDHEGVRGPACTDHPAARCGICMDRPAALVPVHDGFRALHKSPLLLLDALHGSQHAGCAHMGHWHAWQGLWDCSLQDGGHSGGLPPLQRALVPRPPVHFPWRYRATASQHLHVQIQELGHWRRRLLLSLQPPHVLCARALPPSDHGIRGRPDLQCLARVRGIRQVK